MADFGFGMFFSLYHRMKGSPHSTRKKSEFSREDLIKQLQKKNEEAFSYLYDAYSAALLQSINRIVKNQGTAEDILQNVFLKIWQHINTFSPAKGCLYTWMSSIARNEAIDYLRSKQARRLALTSSIQENNADPATIIYTEFTRFDILKSISLLPHKERVIIELFTRGFTCKEIGDLLSSPEGSVKTKMRVSYRKLRAIHL